jgi:hypothetical protein
VWNGSCTQKKSTTRLLVATDKQQGKRRTQVAIMQLHSAHNIISSNNTPQNSFSLQRE